jgi:hypothetical protein
MKSVILASLVLSSISALAQVSTPQGAPIENICSSIAGQNEAQRQTCVRQEEQSRLNGDPAKADPALREFCRATVGEGAELQNVCIQQESLAKAKIETLHVDAAAKSRCQETAGGSYVKMQTCLEKESALP